MISVSSVLITLVLSSVLSSHLVVVAMLETKGEDALMEQDSLGSLLGEESLTDRAMLPSAYANGLMLNNYRADDGNPNVLIFSVRILFKKKSCLKMLIYLTVLYCL